MKKSCNTCKYYNVIEQSNVHCFDGMCMRSRYNVDEDEYCNDWREKVVYTKKCEYCGQEFKTHAEHAKYCCKYHGGKARRMRYLKKKKLIGTWEKQLKKKSRGI